MYLVPSRLLLAAQQWARIGAGNPLALHTSRAYLDCCAVTVCPQCGQAGILNATLAYVSKLATGCVLTTPSSLLRPAGYVGCMKHGVVRTDPASRWFEPQHLLLGPTYYLHAYGRCGPPGLTLHSGQKSRCYNTLGMGLLKSS